MASIQTAIQLTDRMTTPLQHITNALNMTISSFEALDRVSDSAMNTSNFRGVREEINRANQAMEELVDNTNDATNGHQRYNSELNRSTDVMGGLIGKLGQLVSLYAIFSQAKQAINYASDLQEVQNVVDVTFGESAETINAWSKTMLDAYGLNELSAKQFAGTMGAMLKSAGLTGEGLNGMSTNLTQLAGDMASFYNLSGEEAFNKIRSGISGETEPLKQLGIDMSVVNLEAYALSQGITKSYDSMSQAEKVLLRYNYLMNVTADAQGDFARTSDSYANQIRLLSESWREFTGQLATTVLPLLTELMDKLNSGLNWLTEHGDFVVITLGSIAGAVIGYKVATVVATIAQYGFNSALYACPLVWIIGLVLLVVGALYLLTEWIANATGSATSGIGVVLGALTVAVSFIGNLFVTLINTVIDVFVILWNFIGSFVNFFGNVFRDPIGSICRLFFDLVDTVLSLLQTLASVIDYIFGTELGNGVQGWRDSLSGWVDDTFGEEHEIMAKVNAQDYHIKRLNYGEAWDAGAKVGDDLANKMKDMFGGATEYEPPDYSKFETDINGIGEDVGAIKDSLDISNEELKYMKDLAEQEAINRFTTAEIKIDMTNNNNVNNSNDLDGIINGLTEKLYESMEIVAEGV